MSTALEIEKKYLVEFPISWEDLAKLFSNLVDIKRISQTYLEPVNDEPSARIRKTVEGLSGKTKTIYHYNQKKFIEKSVNEEKEFEISKEKYEDNLKHCYKGKTAVDKTRFVFDYEDQIFELDIFGGQLKGLAILEIELKDKNDKVKLPPYLKIIKEVTGEKKYNNFELASKK